MKGFLFYILVFLLCSISSFAQRMVVINDQSNVMTEEMEAALSEHLAQDQLTLTSMVDFKNKCDYYYVTLTAENQPSIEVARCNDESLGSRTLGKNYDAISPKDQPVLIYYAISDIIENPSVQPEVQQDGDTTQSTSTTEHGSRYFFAPAAYGLKKGELYYSTLYFLLHDIQFGINDNFSFGFGTTIAAIPMYVTPKVNFPLNEKTHLAIGDMLIIGTFGSDFIGNLAFASVSRGTPKNNMSLGLGHFSSNENEISEESSSLVLNLAAIVSVSDHVQLLTENYFLEYTNSDEAWRYTDPENFDGFISETYTRQSRLWYGLFGVRFVRRQNELAAWQVGITFLTVNHDPVPSRYNNSTWETYPETGTETLFFPTLSYVRKFRLD